MLDEEFQCELYQCSMLVYDGISPTGADAEGAIEKLPLSCLGLLTFTTQLTAAVEGWVITAEQQNYFMPCDRYELGCERGSHSTWCRGKAAKKWIVMRGFYLGHLRRNPQEMYVYTSKPKNSPILLSECLIKLFVTQ